MRVCLSNLGKGFLAVALFYTYEVQAAPPTVEECLAASENSLRFGSEHKLRAENAQLLICAAESCPEEIRKECLQRFETTKSSIPTIIFDVTDSNGNDLSAVQVTMDNEILADKLIGTALAVDPGEHRFVFTMVGQPPVEKTFVIRAAQKDRHEAIALGAMQPKPAAPPPLAATPPSTPAPVAADSHAMGTQHLAALVVGGVGVIGLAVGTTFGMIANSRKNAAEDICPKDCPDQAGVDRWHDAKVAGNVSTISFLVGGATLATGAVLWFTAKPRANPDDAFAAQVGFAPGMLQLRGTW